MYQERYWKELYQLKVHVSYLQLYQQQSESREKAVNIFLAVTSSSSIAGWAIWQTHGFIWAAIIAASQVVTAIKMFLPFRTRLKALTGLLHEMEEVSTYAEMRWYDVSEGVLSEREIHDLQYEIRARKHQLLRKHLGGGTLPEKPQLFANAVTSAETYFDNFYPRGGRDE